MNLRHSGQGRAEDDGVALQTGQEKVGLTKPDPGALCHSLGYRQVTSEGAQGEATPAFHIRKPGLQT